MPLSRDETYPVSIDRVRDEEGLLALLQDSETRQYRRKKNSIERASVGVDCRQSPPAVTPIHRPENEPPLDYPLINERIAGDPYNYRIAESTQFGVNEFARLLIIICDDEDARSAVMAMGQELSRSQLDAGVTRGISEQ